MRHVRLFLAIAVGGVFGALFVCSKESNPFSDPSNARVIVKSKTFANAGTIDIFTTETLVAVIAVRELVDSFSVIAADNRRAQDTVTRGGPSSPLASNPYTFLFSFTDTGRQRIIIATYRHNGEKVYQEYDVTCRTPLQQDTIRGSYGDSIPVSTRPVGDSDVIYHWDFDGVNAVSSQKPFSIAVVKLTASPRSQGALWVSDLSGSHASPKVPFACILQDGKGPLITANGTIGTSDTILTGDSIFYFVAQIWDPAQLQPIAEAKINGDTFTFHQDKNYVKIFQKTDMIAPCMPVTIKAIDNVLYGNASIKTFYIKYNAAAPHVTRATFVVSIPPTDTFFTSSREQLILGRIEDYSGDSIKAIIRMWINGAAFAKPDTAAGRFVALWSFNAPLVQDTNRITLVAYTFTGDTIGKKSLVVRYDPAVKRH